MASGGLQARSVGATAPAAAEAAIDRTYLARFTMGNDALEQEILELFAAQAPHYLHRLRTAATDADWKEAVHTIKGSAAAVGARQLQRRAELAERIDTRLAPADGKAQRDRALRSIAEATAAACRQIWQMFGH